ncbi:hypothetical protein EV421DRAFT_455976 [Armillaria borealis]|uniref:DUF6534 domain-containing protein n=1 Tax=Armillaria borealis TaxID=47425 RepID=A0AA39N2K1_9AGAR|nr:hypothetical protein EV421DRAFT_455976 [Armillaria borealis]
MSDLGEFPYTYAVPHKTLGVLLVALTVSSSIYGVTCVQAVQYYRRYTSDSAVLKVSVAVVWALETLNQGLTMFSLYHYLVRDRGNMEALSYTEWSLAVPSGTNGLAASIIQFFFAYRVYIMSDRNLHLTGSVCVMSVTQFAVSFAVMVQSIRFPAAIDYRRFEHLVPPCFAITAATDVLITVSLCYYLQIRKSGLEKTDGVVNRLTLLTINNGILSSAVALTAFVCQLAASGTMLPFAMCFLLGKVYTNTLLSSLNSRSSTRKRLSRLIPMEILSSDQRRFSRDKTSSECNTSQGSTVPPQPEPRTNNYGSGYSMFDGLYITREVETFTR